VEPAVEAGIPVRIANTFQPDDPGTLVVHASSERDERPIEGLAVKRGNLIVNLASTRMLDSRGYLAHVFDVLARHGVSVDCVSTSEVSISLTLEGRYEPALREAMQELNRFARISVFQGRSIVCVVGEGMRLRRGMAGEVFGVMGAAGINIEFISQGASELNITFAVRDEDADAALRALHDHFLRGRQRQRGDGL
jgi:aspartate kinase